MEKQGGCGRGSRWFGDELAILRGVLIDEDEPRVEPDDDDGWTPEVETPEDEERYETR